MFPFCRDFGVSYLVAKRISKDWVPEEHHFPQGRWFIYAGLYKLCGNNELYWKLALLSINTFTAWLIGIATFQLTDSPLSVTVAVITYIAYSNSYNYSNRLDNSEYLMVIFLLLAFIGRDNGFWVGWCLAMAVLMKDTALLFVVPFFSLEAVCSMSIVLFLQKYYYEHTLRGEYAFLSLKRFEGLRNRFQRGAKTEIVYEKDSPIIANVVRDRRQIYLKEILPLLVAVPFAYNYPIILVLVLTGIVAVLVLKEHLPYHYTPIIPFGAIAVGITAPVIILILPIIAKTFKLNASTEVGNFNDMKQLGLKLKGQDYINLINEEGAYFYSDSEYHKSRMTRVPFMGELNEVWEDRVIEAIKPFNTISISTSLSRMPKVIEYIGEHFKFERTNGNSVIARRITNA